MATTKHQTSTDLALEDLMEEHLRLQDSHMGVLADNVVLRQMVSVQSEQLSAAINIQKRLEASLYEALGRARDYSRDLANERAKGVS